MPIFTLTDDVRPITPEIITKNVTPPIPEEVKSIPFYMNHTVFLQNELCSHCPHQLHCIQVFPGITLILVSEVCRHSQALLEFSLMRYVFYLHPYLVYRCSLGLH